MTPASAGRRIHAGLRSSADVALLDLEDAVPDDAKDSARAAALDWLAQYGAASTEVLPMAGLRVNALDSLHGLLDLIGLARSAVRPRVLVIPKVESPRDVEIATTVVGAQQDHPLVWALIETPQAIQNLPEILQARGLAGVLFGTADYAAAADCSRTSRALWYPRSVLAAGAAAAGLPAIDSPYFDLRDPDGLRRETEEAAELGFTGKVAIHPAQLPVIQAAFRPSATALDHARAVVSAADASAGGITTVDGQMVGPPLVAAARALTTRAGDTARPRHHEDGGTS
ncbi:HpcH/HpaI aldolase/citrate lyase family protein [Streptomyces sp. NPDC047990]|uniref:HpcH/HpaI aldolase/citrate lyase family protein n=1 Tax=Streptomyces sp. NPDC047990 TaxID=3365496 RepID=UPI0037207285